MVLAQHLVSRAMKYVIKLSIHNTLVDRRLSITYHVAQRSDNKLVVCSGMRVS